MEVCVDMKNILLALATSWASFAHAETPEIMELTFEQRIADCENLWFAAREEEDMLVLGFVYVDPEAGFTYEHYGELVLSEGVFQAVPSDRQGTTRVIHRIGVNVPATCLTDAQATALGLPSSPESMASYKDHRPVGEHHERWAHHANRIGASAIALEHVSKASATGTTSTSLTFEHAVALNGLGQFEETVTLLEPIVASEDATGDLIAELAHAKQELGDLPRAIKLYEQAIRHRKGGYSERRSAFALRIASIHEELGNTRQHDAWMRRAERLDGNR